MATMEMVTTATITTVMVIPAMVTVPVDTVAMAMMATDKAVKDIQLEGASFLPLLQVKKLFTWTFGGHSKQ